MPRATNAYSCSACGATFAKWVGKCQKCGEFGTVDEKASAPASRSVGLKGTLTAGQVSRPASRVRDITTTPAPRTPTGISEMDRILGGGLVSGQMILLAGAPGVGKSTLLLSAANSLSAQGHTVLIVSGEESTEQIAVRARRMNIDADNLLIADESDLSALLAHIEETNPDVLIVDSVQTIASPDVDGRAGAVSQVQEVSAVLTRVAKSRRMPCFLVAQVTKDGNIAGPKILEHLVDTVLFFEGDRNTSLRLLGVQKNRFGSADEIACFEQVDNGINQVPDPSGLFLGERDTAISGTCVTVAMEGRRALLAEVQALVSPTNAPNPRRGVSGLDTARMAMLVAVTERHGKLRLYDKDTFLATVGGLRLQEPAVDLAVCLALASAAWDTALPLGVVAIGEVALSGDIRPCPNVSQRVQEAARLGFTRALIPDGVQIPNPPKGITLIRVNHLGRAFAALRQMGDSAD